MQSGGWGTIVEQRGAWASMQVQRGIRKSLPAGARYCVTIFLDPLVEVSKQMRDFPLRPGETWAPCTDRAHQVYLCMGQPLMMPQQAAWLLERDVEWEYL